MCLAISCPWWMATLSCSTQLIAWEPRAPGFFPQLWLAWSFWFDNPMDRGTEASAGYTHSKVVHEHKEHVIRNWRKRDPC